MSTTDTITSLRGLLGGLEAVSSGVRGGLVRTGVRLTDVAERVNQANAILDTALIGLSSMDLTLTSFEGALSRE